MVGNLKPYFASKLRLGDDIYAIWNMLVLASTFLLLTSIFMLI